MPRTTRDRCFVIEKYLSPVQRVPRLKSHQRSLFTCDASRPPVRVRTIGSLRALVVGLGRGLQLGLGRGFRLGRGRRGRRGPPAGCARRSAAAARSSRRWRGSRTSPRTLSRTSPRPRAQRSRAEAAETAPAVGVTRGDASESAPAATGGPRSLAGFIEVRGERARVGETVTPKSCRG